jgi:pimeloyl-ACP methyl ester carboxylesterase
MTDAGISSGLAEWMGMNLVREGKRFRWRLDSSTMRALYQDFQSQDLWHVLCNRPETHFAFLCAQRNSVLTDEDRQRLANASPNVSAVTIDAGHWLHVDNPNAVIQAVHTLLHR